MSLNCLFFFPSIRFVTAKDVRSKMRILKKPLMEGGWQYTAPARTGKNFHTPCSRGGRTALDRVLLAHSPKARRASEQKHSTAPNRRQRNELLHFVVSCRKWIRYHFCLLAFRRVFRNGQSSPLTTPKNPGTGKRATAGTSNKGGGGCFDP